MAQEGVMLASKIASFLNAPLFGKDVRIERVVPIHLLAPSTVSFVTQYDEKFTSLVNSQSAALVIAQSEYKGKLRSPHILSDSPRLDFLRVLKAFFAPPTPIGIDEMAKIHPEACIGKNVYVGAFACIGPKVTIGDDSVIQNGVTIQGETHLGQRCVVKSNAVIGEEGFGFAYGEFGVPEHFPHIGRIEIGDDVWIGACTTIEQATIDVTVIECNVKIDDLVQIGHNCKVGRNTLVMAGSIICGGAVIGEGCWIAPNTMVKEKVTLGTNAYTGLGSVVIGHVPENTVVVGNPARVLRQRP